MDAVDVLLVDDEEEALALYGKRLARRGMSPRLARDAEEAFAAIAAKVPDVVVLDVRMPGMDGLTALARIKREHPGVQVLMLTGHASVEAAVQGMERGAFDYLVKPVALEDLVQKIHEALGEGGEER
ncbi:response regulator receiver protein [Desulfovibrio sp. X2]|uniref:response regulator n=1 Tax=Desulfovibrio sp. X2 TaxID=941449 RepID=UPI0003588AEB|nr:response regulator [Desulfovibrio sp. X2]EPR41590.1 response regulator receiver protein [Desulfovibrio sp. X2]